MLLRNYVLCGVAFQLLMCSCTQQEAPLTGHRVDVIVSDLSLNISKHAGALQLHESHGNPFIGTVAFSNSPKKLWEYKLYNLSINGNAVAASPIVNGNRVYAMDAGGIVHCIDIDTGKLIWKAYTTAIGETGQSGGALVYTSDDKLLVSTSFAECFVFDAKTGKVVNRMKLPAPCKGDGIIVDGEVAYFNCITNTLCAINIVSGKKLWEYNGLDRDEGYIGMARPAIYLDTIIVPSSSGELYCIQKSTGKEIWKTILSNYSVKNAASAISHLRATPVVKDGVIYITSASGMISAVMASTGDTKWSCDIGSITSVNIVGNHLFIIDENSEIACINIETSAVASVFKLPHPEDRRNCIQKWLTKNSGQRYFQFLTKDALLYISTDGELTYVDYHNGNVIKKINTEREISIAPAIANRTMLILSDDGYITAYR